MAGRTQQAPPPSPQSAAGLRLCSSQHAGWQHSSVRPFCPPGAGRSLHFSEHGEWREMGSYGWPQCQPGTQKRQTATTPLGGRQNRCRLPILLPLAFFSKEIHNNKPPGLARGECAEERGADVGAGAGALLWMARPWGQELNTDRRENGCKGPHPHCKHSWAMCPPSEGKACYTQAIFGIYSVL